MIVKTKFTMKSKVWFYEGKAGWYFLTLPQEPSKSIRRTYAPMARAWGSLPVTVTSPLGFVTLMPAHVAAFVSALLFGPVTRRLHERWGLQGAL